MNCPTLCDVLADKRHFDTRGVTFVEGINQSHFLSYESLYDLALKALSGLQQHGIAARDEVLIQIDDNCRFLVIFWACLLGGIVPVPLTVGQNEDHRQKVFNVWGVLTNPWLVSSHEHARKLQTFADEQGLRPVYLAMETRMVTTEEVMSVETRGQRYFPGEDDIAFIQFSSGSTGNPKGVTLTHRNLLANIRAITSFARYSVEDSMLSWMPLTHDMGLIGFHLNPLFVGMNQYLIPTHVFIRRPEIWMGKASLYRITILCSPNFGYRYFLKHHRRLPKRDWDLSCVRIIYNGAEPISRDVCREFMKCLLGYGLRENAMCPVYGLAEATLAVSMSGLTDEVMTVSVNRTGLAIGGKISIAIGEGTSSGEGDTVPVVNVGRPVDHCSVRIADDEDRGLGEEFTGHIQIRGEGVTRRYYGNDDATADSMTADGWLRTGDIGFFLNGALFVTGRAKDILFLNGQNYYPHDIERCAEEIEGVELNKVAAVGYHSPEIDAEEAVLFVFYRGPFMEFLPLRRRLTASIGRKMGIEIRRVIPIREMPRTTSGKLQRSKLLEEYKKGVFRDVERAMEEAARTSDSVPENPESFGDDTLQIVIRLWEQVLGDPVRSVTSDFFESGGTSLKAAELAMLISKEFNADCPIGLLFDKRTIGEVAHAVTELAPLPYEEIPGTGGIRRYPATSVQRRLFSIWEADKQAIHYNIPVVFSIEGEIQPEKLLDCLQMLTDRHEILRTSFHQRSELECEVHERVAPILTAIPRERATIEEQLKESIRPFDLSAPPLFRCTLIGTDRRESQLLFDIHHIISDGMSLHLLVGELFRLYNGMDLPDLTLQFGDYACWLEKHRHPAGQSARAAYWLGSLEGELPVLQLPIDLERPLTFSPAGAKITFEIGQPTMIRLGELAKGEACTMHVLLFSLYQVLLSKYSGQDDLIIGVPVAGRTHPATWEMQGMFVNNLAIRCRITGDETFPELMQRTRKIMAEAMSNQEYPFEDLVERLGIRRDIGRNAVFDTMFVYQDLGFPSTGNGDLVVTSRSFDPGTSKYDLSMEVVQTGGSFRFGLEYATSLFTGRTAEAMVRSFQILADGVALRANSTVSDLPVMTREGHYRLVSEYNNSRVSYPEQETIHGLVLRQAERTPDAIAIEFRDMSYTYGQLSQRSHRIAAGLKTIGVTHGEIVAVMADRGPTLIFSILGILLAGCCYLPLDEDLPEERVGHILRDSRCRYLITTQRRANPVFAGWPGVQLTPGDLEVKAQEIAAFHPMGAPGEPAYVIYTSGTSGKPKGVVIGHRSLVNYTWWAVSQYIRGEAVVFPLFTSISFDLTVTSIFTPLISGNKIRIYGERGAELPLKQVLEDDRSDVVKLTPSHLAILYEFRKSMPGLGSRIRRFIVGGENLSTRLAQDIIDQYDGNVEIFNEYGPTEATVGCMIYRYGGNETSKAVPIGKPAANTRIYLLDQYRRPVPGQAYGQIFIGGHCLATGYLHDDPLTAEKFVPDPFVPGERMYASGDRGKWLPDGMIEYIGRIDQQVKINGYRIELGEIEHHLRGYCDISEVAVALRPIGQRSLLVAWYKSELPFDPDELSEYLSLKVPHYMIPSRYVHIRQMPLTRNGKPAFAALPDPELEEALADRPDPQSPMEEMILGKWKDVLRKEGIGVTDNFFEWGGDSIKAVQISSRLLEAGIAVTTKDILTYHTVRQLSRHARLEMAMPQPDQSPATGEKKLSPIDSWFFSQELQNPNYYHLSLLLRLQRRVDKELLQESFRQLVRRHDSLRLNYDPVRKALHFNNAHPDRPFPIGEYLIADEDPNELAEICSDIKRTFDIQHDLLLKAALISNDHGGGPGLLFLTAHHLAVDAVSWRILLEDLYELYTAVSGRKASPSLRRTASLLQWEQFVAQRDRQSQKLTDAICPGASVTGTYSLPKDREDGDRRVKYMAKVKRRLPKEKTGVLVTRGYQTYRANLLVLLNTALVLALKEWTGARRFPIEQEGHGRDVEGIDISRTTGWFTILYPVVFELPDGPLGDQIVAIKQQLEDGYIPGAAEKADIRVNYLGQFGKEFDNDLYSFCDLPHGYESDPENDLTVPLEFNAWIMGDELMVELNYSKKTYSTLTMDSLISGFVSNLELLAGHLHGETQSRPSEFSLASISQEELDALFDQK